MMPQPYQDPTEEDLINFQQPVAEMDYAMQATSPAIPPQQSQGLSFDFNGLIQQLETNGFDSLSRGQQELLYFIKENPQVQMSPEQMANYVIDQEEQFRAASTPEAQAKAEKAQLDLAAAEAEAQTKAAEAASAQARISSVLDTIDNLEPELDNLVGPLAPAAQMKDKWIDPETYAKRFDLANTTKNDVLEAAKYVKPLSNDERKFLEDMFPKIDDPPPVWRNYFDRTRRMLGAGLSAPAPAPQATPQPTPQPTPQATPQPQRIIRGQVFQFNPQTGKYVPAQ